MKIRRYTCRTVRNMLPLHVGRDLDPRHVGHVDEHLHGCLSCFREFRELSAMRGRLGVLAEESLPAGVLAGFTEEVMARIAVGEPGPAAEAPRSPSTWYALPRLTAAAAMLLVCLAGWRLIDDGEALPRSQHNRAMPVLGGTVGDTSRRSTPASPVLPQVGAPVSADPKPRRAQPMTPRGARSGQMIIILEGGTQVPSQQDQLLLEMAGEAALNVQPALRSGGLQQDDPGRMPRKRQP